MKRSYTLLEIVKFYLSVSLNNFFSKCLIWFCRKLVFLFSSFTFNLTRKTIINKCKILIVASKFRLLFELDTFFPIKGKNNTIITKIFVNSIYEKPPQFAYGGKNIVKFFKCKLYIFNFCVGGKYVWIANIIIANNRYRSFVLLLTSFFIIKFV